MQRRRGSFRSTQGLTLHTLTWAPDEDVDARGVVVIAHGLGEHSDRYMPLAKSLTDRGLRVHAVDLPGHGRSAGRRGEVSSFEALVSDLHSFVDEVRGSAAGLHCGLIGHSMGGALAAAVAARYPGAVDALVLSAPYLRHGRPVSELQKRALRLLARVSPRLGVDRVETEALSRLPHEVEAYRSDPLVYHGRVNARTAVQLFEGFRTLEDASLITAPLLIIHGSDDRIAHPSASRELADSTSSRDVTLEIVSGGYHELLNDVDGERMRQRVSEWLEARLVD